MSRSRSRGQQSADVEECPHDPTLQGDGAPKKPVTAEEALEIAIGESQDVEYTIDSDNSPYLEVRANVPNTDDPTLPINTFRMWFLGIVFTLVCLDHICRKGGIAVLTANTGRHGRESILLHALSQCYNHLLGSPAYKLPRWMLFCKGNAYHDDTRPG